MERQRTEAQFKETKKTLGASKEKINEFLKQETLNSDDRVRLTRVLQLIDRYQPKREDKTTDVFQWKKYLESVFRFLPSLKSTQKPIKNISAESYLMAEKSVAALRELRRIDIHLRKEKGFTESDIVNQHRSETILQTETLDTSLTLEYEKKHWGVERVALDGIQNHLPSDAKGEQVWVRFLVDGKWVSLPEAREKRTSIKAVRFADDGVGFDVKNLTLLYSTKSEETESSGQFGEGMKMMAAAALRERLEPEIESQNWRAKPVAKKIKLTDTRNKKTRTVEQLSFDVDHLDGAPMIGSRTTFWHPTEAFLDEVLNVEQKVLALRESFRPLFVSPVGEIVDLEPGAIFAKGIYIKQENSLFSYNFPYVETNRDRNAIISSRIDNLIIQTICELSNKKLVKTLLQRSIVQPNAIESSFYSFGYKATNPTVWTQGFYEAFGKDAVLDTGFDIPDFFHGKKPKKIKLPSFMTQLLLDVGVQTDKKTVPDFWTDRIPTSLTLDYGKNIWDEERILLDAVQNHLPHDSHGSMIGLRFQTRDDEWHWFPELQNVKDDEIKAIKIFDNGKGYDARLLGLLYSTKETSDESAGKFGEGLKMLCVAALRHEMNMTLQSQNWIAKPKTVVQEIEGKKIEQLVFDITYTLHKTKKDDDPESDRQSSSTTFLDPSPAFVKEFRDIPKKVLAIEHPSPIQHTKHGHILSLEQGLLYVKELLIPGDHHLLFSYHLPKFDVQNRDRNVVNQEELLKSLAAIWSEVTNTEVIRSFLFKAFREAKAGERAEKLEFAINFTPKNPEMWKQVFEEMFGKDVAIRDIRSESDDAFQNLHVGLELLSFSSSVFSVLQYIGLPTYDSRIRELTDTKILSDDEWTQEEREIVKTLQAIDEYLPNNRPSSIRVYERKIPDQKIALGFSDGLDIYLLREILADFSRAADVYVHEKTHHNTRGSLDASADFRNYLTFALSRLAIEELIKIRPDLLENKKAA